MTYGWEYNDDPFVGYDLVVSDSDYGEDYSWGLTDVYHKDGKFYTFEDGGCSCNGPYEGAQVSDLQGPVTFAQAISGLNASAKEEALRWEAPRG